MANESKLTTMGQMKTLAQQQDARDDQQEEKIQQLEDEREVVNGITTAGTGAAYTATVPGITALNAGVSFLMVPHTVSTAKVPTLNVNGLGAKAIRRRLSNNSTTTVASELADWLGANKPVRVTYNGMYWLTDLDRPNAADIYGVIPVDNGGVPSCTTDDNGKFLRVVSGAAAWGDADLHDWNQMDETQPDYIKNRTHYAVDSDFSYSGPYTLATDIDLPDGMAAGACLGTFTFDSCGDAVPYSCDYYGGFGSTYSVKFGEVGTNTSGPTYQFCITATPMGDGSFELYLYLSSATLFGATPTISNVKLVAQLDKQYLPMADIIAAVKASYPSAEGASF